MELVDFLGLSGTAISLLFISSTIPGIIENGSTGMFDKIPIVYMVLNMVTQGLWLIYSVMIENEILIFTNFICHGLSVLNLMIYYYFKSKLPRMILGYVFMAFGVYILVVSEFSEIILGSAISFIALITNSSHLEQVYKACEKTDKSFIDVNMVGSGLVSSFVWIWYGILINDVPYMVTHSYSFCVRIFSVGVYFMYRKNKVHVENIDK